MPDYNISLRLPSLEVLHLGQPITIRREQDASATIRAEYALTARPCPPYTASSRCNWHRALKRLES